MFKTTLSLLLLSGLSASAAAIDAKALKCGGFATIQFAGTRLQLKITKSEKSDCRSITLVGEGIETALTQQVTEISLGQAPEVSGMYPILVDEESLVLNYNAEAAKVIVDARLDMEREDQVARNRAAQLENERARAQAEADAGRRQRAKNTANAAAGAAVVTAGAAAVTLEAAAQVER